MHINDTNLMQAVPFFMVTDMDRSLDFYVSGLGFKIKSDWRPEGKIEWCCLERDGVMHMLQVYRSQRQPQHKLGVGVSICFICSDALKLYQEFLLQGLKPQEPFVGNNMWVVSIYDPDGYKLDFESTTDVPEETVYSDWIKTKP